MKDTEFVGGALGTLLGVAGTAMQTDDILRIISLIITIIGNIITWVVIPIINWHKEAKKDGKITADEIKEGVNIISNGIEHINKENKDNGKQSD